MKNLFTSEMKEIIEKYAKQDVYFEIVEATDQEITAKVTQKSLSIGKVLTQKELHSIGKNILQGQNKTVRVRPQSFSLDIRIVTPDWVKEKMKALNIRKNDIVSQLHLHKHILNSFLKGNYNLSRMSKASLFWYFFLYTNQNNSK